MRVADLAEHVEARIAEARKVYRAAALGNANDGPARDAVVRAIDLSGDIFTTIELLERQLGRFHRMMGEVEAAKLRLGLRKIGEKED